MKTVLNKEQSNHLLKLGCKFLNNLAIQDNNGDFYMMVELEDFLNGEILPQKIFDKELYVHNYLIMKYTGTQWQVGYSHIIPFEGHLFLSEKFNEELIDALYELTCWYYEEFKN